MCSRVLVVLLVALVAAGCGAAQHAAPAVTSKPIRPCKLDAAQRHAVALALRDIRRLRRIQAPLHKYSDLGTPAQEAETGRFLADMTSVRLPINVRAHLLHVAKSAVGLCGRCFQGLEAEEPVMATRLGQKRCG
jgi:hypothetical protein